jgi:purine-binding chemotaxis protein CheW
MADIPSLRLVLFRLGSLACAAAASTVREVIPAGQPTRIPGALGSVAGLLNLRGALLTVVDGRLALGLTGMQAMPESVLVITQESRALGLAVDEVLDLVDVPTEDLAQGESLPGVDPRLVHAVGRHEGRVFAVLDVGALLTPAMG